MVCIDGEQLTAYVHDEVRRSGKTHDLAAKGDGQHLRSVQPRCAVQHAVCMSRQHEKRAESVPEVWTWTLAKADSQYMTTKR